MVKRNLGFFAASESLVANNVVLAVYRNLTNLECRPYLLRQAFEDPAFRTGTEVADRAFLCDLVALPRRLRWDVVLHRLRAAPLERHRHVARERTEYTTAELRRLACCRATSPADAGDGGRR